MCWHAPTARLYIARPALAPRKSGAWPSWAMNALGGIPETIDPTVQCAARVLARSALRVLTDGSALRRIRTEFEARTSDPIAPLADYPPPIGFSWPEYVQTPRGRDWWIPG